MQVREDCSLNPTNQPVNPEKSSQDSVVQRTWKTALQQRNAQPVASSEEIVNKLQRLLISAEKSDPFNKHHAIQSALQTLNSSRRNLIQAIDIEKDIHERLSDIIRSSVSSNGRQLKEMQLYLTLLSNHLGKESNINPLVSKVAEVANVFLEITSTPWINHLEKIEKIVRESGISEKSELLENLSLLNTLQATQLNTRSFAHIHAEALIKGSHLEGNYSEDMISYLKNYLIANQENYLDLENCHTLISMLEDAERFCEVGQFSVPVGYGFYEKDFKVNHQKFHDLFSEKIIALKPGEKTLIETGWIGHSMKLGIERNKNNKFCLTIYNTGVGIVKYHPFIQTKDEILFQPFIKINDIEEKNLLDKNFTQAFYELQRIKEDPSSYSRATEYNADDVYRLFGKVLGGHLVPCDGNKEKFMPPQNSGVCTWASLQAVLFENLKVKDYHKLTCDISLDSLCAYYQENKLTLSKDEEKHLLLEHASIYLAQQALNTYENKAISLERLHEIYATLKELKVVLDQAQWESNQIKSNLGLITFGNLEPLGKHCYGVELEGGRTYFEENSGKSYKIEKEEPPFIFDSWINDPKEFNGGIDHLLNYLNTNPNKKEKIQVLETFFIELAHQKDKDFWDNIPSDDVQKLIVNFADLSEFLFEATDLYPERNNSYSAYSIYMYSIMHLLGKSHPEFQINVDKDICELCLDTQSIEVNLYKPEERYLRLRSLEILNSVNFKSAYTPVSIDSSKDHLMKIEPSPNKIDYTGYDFDYIAKFLDKNPYIKEFLIRDNPLLAHKLGTREFQVALLASDWYGKYLPTHFCALRRQNLIVKSLFQQKSLHAQDRIFSTVPYNPYSKDELYLKREFSVKSVLSELRDFQNKKVFEEFIKAKDRTNTNCQYISEKDIALSSISNFSSEFEKDLAYLVLRGDVNDTAPHLEQQVTKTLAYFIEHFELLEHPDMRSLCRYLLFENEYIEKILQLNPSFNSLLKSIITSGIEFFEEKENLAGIVFFIELGRNINEILKFNNYSSNFPDFKEKINNLLSKEWNPKEKALLYQQLVASYIDNKLDTFSKEDAKQLLISLFHIKIHPIKEQKESRYLSEQINQVSIVYREKIKSILKSEDGSEICNAVLSNFISIDQEQVWDLSKNPYCISNNKKIIFDVQNLEFYIDDISLEGIPENLLKKPQFIKIFAGNNYPCRRVKKYVYEFIDEKGNETQLISSGEIRQKFKDGLWYKLTSLQSITSEIETSKNISKTSKLPKDFIEVLKNNSIWTPIYPQRWNLIHIRDSSLNIILTISVEESEIKKCCKNPNSENPLYLVDLKDVKNFDLSNLLKDAMLWKNQRGVLKELEISSLDLFFDLKNEKGFLQAYCHEFPGYYLASNQHYKGLRHVEGSIVLENDQGQRKLVLPYGKIKPEKGTLNTQFTIDKHDQFKKRSMTFELDSTSKPIPKTKEEQLYLANILFSQKKYAEAQKLLMNSFSYVLPYKESELFLIKNIADIAIEADDNSAQAMALILTACSLVPANINLGIEQKSLQRIQIQYQTYLQLKSTIPHLILPYKEEVKALTNLNLLNELSESKNNFITIPNISYESKLKTGPFVDYPGYIFKTGKLEESEKIILTRFPRFNFAEMCELAEKDPLKLELLLLGIDKISSAKENLITLWRAISHGFIGLNYESRYITIEIIIDMYESKKTLDLFKLILEHAELFENKWKAEQLKNNPSFLMQGIGDLPKRYATTKEAQSIGIRSSSDIELTADPLLPRPPFLSDAQFVEFFSSIENRGLKLEPTEIEALKKAVSQEGEQPFQSEATQLSKHIETYWKLDHHNTEWHDLNYSIKDESLPELGWMLTPEFGKMCVRIQNNPFQLKEILQLNKKEERPFSQELITLLSAISHGFMKETLEDILNLTQTKSIGTLLRVLKEAKKFEGDRQHIDFQTSLDKIDKLKTLLLVESAELNKQSMIRMQELLAFANQLPIELKDAILFETEKMGNMRQEINLNDLILFTARSRHFTLEGKNPNIIEHEKELLNRCLEYLDIKAQHQQLNRAIYAIENLEKVEIGSQNYHRISETLYKELTRQVPYEAHQFPELLVFEVMEEIGLHEWQVSDLKRMLDPSEGENSNVILEKVMGAGKTKVYLPLLALSKADGDHISMIVVHSSQYETVAQALRTSSGQMFNQVAHTLSFTRDSDTSLEGLNKILNELEEVRREKHFFVVTDKSMHSLGLAFDQMWNTYLENEKEDPDLTDKSMHSLGLAFDQMSNTFLENEKEDPDLVEQIKVMQKILLLIKTKGKATFDEADLLLNCRYEVVYSLGDAEPINPKHANVVADLYEAIDPILDRMGVFTHEGYKEIKPELISAFLSQMKDQNLDVNLVTAYFNDQKDGENYVDTLPENTKNALAIAHYEFAELLPIVLEKRSGEHYAYSEDPNKIFPVPCLASGVPSKTSEFSFPYALLDYTMQTLKHQGVSPNLLKDIIKNLQFRAKKERKANPILGLQNTQAYNEFLELCGPGLSLPLLEIRDREIEQIVENYKKNPKLIYNFAKKHLLTAVTLHSKKITSTPYTLQKMFCEVQGFTGTPWNSKTYPNDLTISRDKLSAGKTQGIIWKNSQTVHSLKSDNFIDEIALILQQGNHHAFIDVGALFNGVENQKVAENLLEVLSEKFRGILFYKDNLPYVLERNKSTLIPYEKYESTQSLFIFYDQWHTTGTDYKIGGKSLLSVGKNTKMRDLEQGYMRDRQAELGERVEFLIPPETQRFLQVTLNLEANVEVSTAHLLRGAEIVQERELKDQLLMATFGKLNQVVHSHLRDLEFSDPEKVRENRKAILNLIVDIIKDSPWEQFGHLQKDIPTELFFSEVIKSTLIKLTPLMNENLTKESLEKELWDCVDLASLPEVMSDASKSSPEKLVEKESQTQLQQEKMALVQKEVVSDQEYSNKLGPIHWSWDPKASPSERSFYRLVDYTSLIKESKPQLTRINGKSLPIFRTQPPIFKTSVIWEKDRIYKSYADVFDLELSYNFFPKLEARPFSKGLIDVKNMLICRDKETGKTELILISSADEGYFYEKLAEDRGVGGDREVDVALYNMTLGIIQSNSEDILNGSDKIIDEQVRRKIVQAKFFNGESLYTEDEKVMLEEWINNKGVERMKTLFIDHILVHKKEKRKEFHGSVLEEIFSNS